MSKHYIFFTRRALPLPNVASQVQVAHSANAAANLGYSTVLVYIYQGQEAINPIQWLRPFHPEKPGENMVKAYNLASGTPIVATKIPILKEFHSCNAIVEWCEPDNPIAFAQCIQKVLLTHPRKEEGYIKSIEYAKEFSYENRISKIMSYVDESIRPEKVGIGSSTYET